MEWKIAQAKQRFSYLVRSASTEPQLIYNRDHLVAAVVAPEDLRELEEYREQARRRPTLVEVTDPVRRACTEEDYELELTTRSNRPNAFVQILDEIPD